MRVLIALLAFLLATPAFAASVSNRTTMTFDPGHGTQIEYVAADGTNYLWYPGNRVVLPGHWKLEGKLICFQYGANTYNPVTRTQGGNFDCERLSDYTGFIVETAKGDPFGLAHRTGVPFQLTRSRTTIAALLKRAGIMAQ